MKTIRCKGPFEKNFVPNLNREFEIGKEYVLTDEDAAIALNNPYFEEVNAAAAPAAEAKPQGSNSSVSVPVTGVAASAPATPSPDTPR